MKPMLMYGLAPNCDLGSPGRRGVVSDEARIGEARDGHPGCMVLGHYDRGRLGPGARLRQSMHQLNALESTRHARGHHPSLGPARTAQSHPGT